MSYRIVPGPQRSELQKFASWFHQDWELIFPDFHAGAEMYLSKLGAAERQVLKCELEDFIQSQLDASPGQVKSAWLRLGAQGWQSTLDIKETLHDFVAMM